MEGLPALLILGILLFLSAIFSGSEVALLGPPASWLARRVPGWFRSFLAYPDGLLVAILIGNNLVNSYAAILFDLLARDFFPPAFQEALSVIAFGMVVFALSELPPKLLAYTAPEKIARLGAYVITPFALLTSLPFRLLRSSSPTNGPSLSEILELLDLQDDEQLVPLRSFLSFLNMTVDDVMTPWSRVRWIPPDEDPMEAFRKYPHHTLPVYDPEQGAVVGLATLKASLCRNGGLLPPRVILDTAPLPVAFDRFRRERLPMLLVVDEFGNLRGIITQRDIVRPFLEPVRSPMVRPVDDHTWIVDAGALVEELYQQTGIELPGPRFDTVAAWLLDHLERIPEEGEIIEVDGVEIEVLRRQGAAVERLKITRSTPA